MPYIITTTTPERFYPERPVTNSQTEIRHTTTNYAVATLDKAHKYIGNFTDDDSLWNEWCRTLNEGGTIDPLADGTIIEVKEVEWIDIGIDPFDAEVDAEVDSLGGYSAERCDAAIEAFNKRENAKC